ncbi:MAG: GCN5-related N-acetyltransferase [Parcubacteria group bacterium GW2011_GWB1_41_4]|nr:MAG: GCN5-related N-acetyltransferase [Parcubacteria group bacterium GW2011_GWB1_41_4]
METEIFGSKKVTIRKLSNKDLRNTEKFQKFVNYLVEEDVQISKNKKVSLKEEKKWLEGMLGKIKSRKTVFLVAESNDVVVGDTGIDLGHGRQDHIGTFGIMILKGYRGVGLGVYLMKEIIKLAKKDLKPKPKIIRLGVFPTNKPAISLYKKLGFKKVARVPRQFQYKGKLVDEIIMLLSL